MNIEQIVKQNVSQWLNGSYDENTKRVILDMQKNNPKELTESFYQNLEFGTGGLRGLMGVGTNRMNIYTVGMATQGLANYLLECFKGEEIKVAISYDNRNNGDLFSKTTAKIFAANGIKVYMFETMRPTPELSFAIRYFGCQSGVMVTASHNPKEYNGYKAYWNDGAQMVEPHDENVIANVKKITDAAQVKWSGNEHLIEIIGKDFDQKFIDHVLALKLNADVVKTYSDMKIVYTPIHGTGANVMPQALQQYGFNAVTMVPEQAVADGNFPTVIHPNPEDPKALAMAIDLANKIGSDLVLASDPDADRIAIAVRRHDGQMQAINGNQACALLSYYLLMMRKETGKLSSNDYIIKTIVTTDLVRRIADDHNVHCYNVLTGFKYIADVIRRNEGKLNFVGGGEESYGYMIGDAVRDKDSIASGAMIAEIAAWAKSQNKNILDIIIDIYCKYGLYFDGQVAITKKGIEGVEEIKAIMREYRNNPPQKIAGKKVVKLFDYKTLKETDITTGKQTDIDLPESNVLQFLTEDDSLISVRPSGTEPKIKFYFGVREPMSSPEAYEETLQKAKDKIEDIKKSLSL